MSHAAYNDHAEAEARETMLREWRAKAPPKPTAEEPLLALYKNLMPEQAAASAPYSELVYVANSVLQVSLEATAGVVADEARRADKRVDAAGAKIVALEASVAELTGQISDLMSALERVRAARGATDGRDLPSSLIRAKPRAAPKRKTSKT
jgi:hypothetical protein